MEFPALRADHYFYAQTRNLFMGARIFLLLKFEESIKVMIGFIPMHIDDGSMYSKCSVNQKLFTKMFAP